MHGFIFSEIRKYVTAKFDEATWFAILENAGIGRKEYENFLNHPDEEAVGIVTTASKMTEIPVAGILEDFGTFVGGDLLKVYRPIIDPSWRTLDFLLNVEQTIHHVVRTRNRQAVPPVLACRRLAEDEVMILYRSARRMCALAKGIAKGVAANFHERVEIAERTCMLEGANVCEIHVRTLPATLVQAPPLR